jgi:hypothetical protein
MKYTVSGICRTTGFITTREVEAADALAAGSIASADMIVFDVDPAGGQSSRNPSSGAPAAAWTPAGDAARRVAFAGTLLLLAGLLAWSAHENAAERQPVRSAAQQVVVATSPAAATHPTLQPLARAAAAPPLVRATPVTLTH